MGHGAAAIDLGTGRRTPDRARPASETSFKALSSMFWGVRLNEISLFQIYKLKLIFRIYCNFHATPKFTKVTQDISVSVDLYPSRDWAEK